MPHLWSVHSNTGSITIVEAKSVSEKFIMLSGHINMCALQIQPEVLKRKIQITCFCGDNIRTVWWRTLCDKSSVLNKLRNQQNS